MRRNPTPYLSKWATCLQLMFCKGGTLSAGLPISWSVMNCINDILVECVHVEGRGLSTPWRKTTKSQFWPSKLPLPLPVPLGPLSCQPLPLPGRPLSVPPLPGPPLCSGLSLVVAEPVIQAIVDVSLPCKYMNGTMGMKCAGADACLYSNATRIGCSSFIGDFFLQ